MLTVLPPQQQTNRCIMTVLTAVAIFLLYVVFSFVFAIFICKNLIGEDLTEEEEQAMLDDVLDYLNRNQF